MLLSIREQQGETEETEEKEVRYVCRTKTPISRLCGTSSHQPSAIRSDNDKLES